jgi:hypothetical protein
MALSDKTKNGLLITGGLVIIGGGIIFAINKYNKYKATQTTKLSGGAESGTGETDTSGSQSGGYKPYVPPVGETPAQAKKRIEAATQGRDSGYKPYIPPAGETTQQAIDRVKAATQGRGADGFAHDLA